MRLDFGGYFDLYNIPFRFIHLFDFTEKKSPLLPGGMNRGSDIFDFLTAEALPCFVSDPALTEEGNRDRLAARLRIYEDWIAQLLEAARQQDAEVRLYIFSDHGMANCDQLLDPKAQIDALPVVMEKDYAVVYDSTMARFWFFNNRARQLITEALGPGGDHGHPPHLSTNGIHRAPGPREERREVLDVTRPERHSPTPSMTATGATIVHVPRRFVAEEWRGEPRPSFWRSRASSRRPDGIPWS